MLVVARLQNFDCAVNAKQSLPKFLTSLIKQDTHTSSEDARWSILNISNGLRVFFWMSFYTSSLLSRHQVYCRLHSKNSMSQHRRNANFLAGNIFFSTGTYGFTFSTSISSFTAISCMFYGERNGAVSRFYWLMPQKVSWPIKNAASKVAPSGLSIPTCY
jgi:hypothetical protein